MNFVADERVDKDIVIALRASSHVVAYVAKVEPGITSTISLGPALTHELQT